MFEDLNHSNMFASLAASSVSKAKWKSQYPPELVTQKSKQQTKFKPILYRVHLSPLRTGGNAMFVDSFSQRKKTINLTNKKRPPRWSSNFCAPLESEGPEQPSGACCGPATLNLRCELWEGSVAGIGEHRNSSSLKTNFLVCVVRFMAVNLLRWSVTFFNVKYFSCHPEDPLAQTIAGNCLFVLPMHYFSHWVQLMEQKWPI